MKRPGKAQKSTVKTAPTDPREEPGKRKVDPELVEQMGPRLSHPSVIDPWEDGALSPTRP